MVKGLAFSLLLLNAIHAQPWAGIIAPARAVDWSIAGVAGGIPARTTQCGATIAAYGTSAAPASPSAITSALSTCNNSNEYVQLGAGTFYLNGGISMVGYKNVTLRGMGANQTSIVFSGGGTGCYNSGVALEGSCLWPGGGEQNVCTWSAGYAPGSTTITLANCGSTTPALGSLSNLKVGSLLILDQVDETTDTGTIWNCSTVNVCANTVQGGAERTNGPSVNGTSLRSQQQAVTVTAINGSSVSISPAIYMPNWRSAQAPQAWFPGTVATGIGLENLSMNAAGSSMTSTVNFTACTGCWVAGVQSLYANRSHVRVTYASHIAILNNYIFANQTGGSVSYGIEFMGAWNSIIQNNIFEQSTDSDPSCSGPCEGNVIGYNFDVNNVYTSTTGFMQSGFYQHASGDAYNLWEGNISPGYNADDIHGTHHFETLFRNQLLGQNQAPCNGAPCTLNTIPITLAAGSRYMNVLGNVLGTAGYHNNYNCIVTSSSCTYRETSIYDLQQTSENAGTYVTSIAGFCLSPACTSFGDYDPQVTAYLFRWGNWDVVNNAAQWNSSEVPSGISSYGNPVPSSQTLPASFYLSSAPSWFGSLPFPGIGPDVTGGTISGVGGHANMNPAMNCFLKVMGGSASGTGGPLAFNANTCYGTGTVLLSPPPTFSATVH